MAASRRGWVVWAAGMVSAASIAGALWLAASHGGAVWWILSPAAPLLGCAGVGILLCLRVPGNPLGWLFLGCAVAIGVGRFCDAYSASALGLPGAQAVGAAAGPFEGGVLFFLPGLLLLFPDGRLPSPRWRWVAMVWAAVTIVFLVGTLVASGLTTLDSGQRVQNPLGVGGTVGAVGSWGGFVALLLDFAVMLAAAVSLVLRYRQATGSLRQQLKWFGAAASALALIAVASPLFWALSPPWSTTVFALLLSTAGTGVAIATGIAILRYRLYEIDVIIRRTLVYTTLVGMLAVVYLGGIYLTGLVLRAVTGQSDALAVTVSTLLVAVGFQPMRTRIQRAVDRRFYRTGYDASRTLEEFTGRLRDKIDLDVLQSEVLDVVRATVQPRHASLWLRPGSREGGSNA